MCDVFRRRRRQTDTCDAVLNPTDVSGFGDFGPNFGCEGFTATPVKLDNVVIFENEDTYALPCQNNAIDFIMDDNKYCFKQELDSSIAPCGTAIKHCECECTPLGRRQRRNGNAVAVIAPNADPNAHVANALSCDWSAEAKPPAISPIRPNVSQLKDKTPLLVSISLSAACFAATAATVLLLPKKPVPKPTKFYGIF